MQLSTLAIAALVSTSPEIAQESSTTNNCLHADQIKPDTAGTDAVDCTTNASTPADAAEPSLLLSDSEMVLPEC